MGEQLDASGGEELIELLTDQEYVYLALEHQPLTEEQCERIRKRLISNTGLGHLMLWNNNIGDKGAVLICKALHANSTLSSLNLRKNGLENRAARTIAEALRHNTSLTFLDLRENEIKDAGAEELAASLSSSGIVSLNLYGNKIENRGGAALLGAIDKNKRITLLNVYGNLIMDNEILEEVKKMETRNKARVQNLKLNSAATTEMGRLLVDNGLTEAAIQFYEKGVHTRKEALKLTLDDIKEFGSFAKANRKRLKELITQPPYLLTEVGVLLEQAGLAHLAERFYYRNIISRDQAAQQTIRDYIALGIDNQSDLELLRVIFHDDEPIIPK